MKSVNVEAMNIAVAEANAMASKLITLAEGLFGPMTSPWKFCGVIFRDHAPHLFYEPESGSVQISLSLRALDDAFQRDFQLAHEVCHLLYPSFDPECPDVPATSVLNEGISTFFSVIVTATFHGREYQQNAIESLATYTPKYFRAYQLVSDLLSKDENAILTIRKIQPMINEVNADDLRNSGLLLTDDDITTLVELF